MKQLDLLINIVCIVLVASLGMNTIQMPSGRYNGVVDAVDSHVHVWSDGQFPYTYTVDPPLDLIPSESTDLLSYMIPNGVKKAVIIQPINHKFDHRFLIETLEGADRNFFKGVCLLDPTQPIETGCDFLENMRARGFVGVRFNPGLWLGTESMSDTRGLSFFRKAGELNLSVGFMCFKGLHLHIEEIKTLLDNSPQTKVVIDHMGFCYQKNEWNTIAWNSLLDLSHYPQVYVKISAFFRNSGQRFPFLDLDSRLVDLVSAYGSSRLLFGTDYPFVKQIEGGYEEVSNAMSYWPASQSFLNEKDWGNLYRDTAMDLYEITD